MLSGENQLKLILFSAWTVLSWEGGHIHQGESNLRVHASVQGRHGAGPRPKVSLLSPLVAHTISVHGGIRPKILYVIKKYWAKAPIQVCQRECGFLSAATRRSQYWTDAWSGGHHMSPSSQSRGVEEWQVMRMTGLDTNIQSSQWAKMILEEVGRVIIMEKSLNCGTAESEMDDEMHGIFQMRMEKMEETPRVTFPSSQEAENSRPSNPCHCSTQ